MLGKQLISALLCCLVLFGCQPNETNQVVRDSRTTAKSIEINNNHLALSTASPPTADDSTATIEVLAPCSEDGQIGCVTTENFKSVDVSKISPASISLGTSIAGVAGLAVHATEVCSSRGQQNCVAAGPFFVGPPCSASEYGCYLTSTPGVLQSFSAHQPLYVRVNGHDRHGNGSAESPFATPQKAFEVAYAGKGEFVIDLGEGAFSGVDLNVANASEWPERIVIRGAGSGVSKLGGINASGFDASRPGETATSGKNLNIVSNNTVHLGNINARGGYGCCSPQANAGVPGFIELTGVVSGNINIDGTKGGVQAPVAQSDGGTLRALYSSIGDISANGVTDSGDGLVSNGGVLTLTSSSAGTISANGGSRLAVGCGSHGGRVYLKDSSIKGARLAGGSGQDARGELCDGQQGTVRGSRQ